MLRDGTFVIPAILTRGVTPRYHVTSLSADERPVAVDGRLLTVDDTLWLVCGQLQEAGDRQQALDESLWEVCVLQYQGDGTPLGEDDR